MYESDASALVYLVAAVMVFLIGGATALYERFRDSSVRFFVVATLLGAWLLTLGLARLAADPAVAVLWYRQAVALPALTAPAVFSLAGHLTGFGTRRLSRLTWALGLAWFALAALTPVVQGGVSAVAGGEYLSWPGVVGLLFVAFVVGMIAATVWRVFVAWRAAPPGAERRRYEILLIAAGVGSLIAVDYVLPEPAFGHGVGPLAITLAVAIAMVAQVLYRALAPSALFAAEEVLRTMGDAVLVCDQRGVVRMANPEALRLLGSRSSDVVGLPLGSLLTAPPEGGEFDPSFLASDLHLPTAPVRDRRMALLPADGPAIPVRVSIVSLESHGAAVGWVVVARDIRDRLASDQALAASELRYRSIFWHNPGVAYEFSTDGTVMQINPAAERLLELDSASMAGKPFVDVVAPADRDRAAALFAEVLEGNAREYELEVVTTSGERRSLRGVSIPVLAGGRVTSVFGVGLDVTEETQAKHELEVQRRYFAELFDGSPEAIVVLDAEGEIRRANSEFIRLFGYTREEAEGAQLDDLIVPAEQREDAAELGRLTVEGKLTRAELVRRRKDGTLVDVSLLARLIRIPGQPLHLYAIYRDITDQRKAERQLREREDDLRHAQRLEAVGKLAGGVAHDFNNLLTVINGHARFVLGALAPDHPVRPDVEEIERAGLRAAALTQQLLAFSRRQVLRPAVLDLNTVVREMERMLRRLIGSHIRLVTSLDARPAAVLADRGQLEQVMMNLVVNARDAMPGGGTLTIATRTKELDAADPELENWQTEPGRYVLLVVEDTGEGMTQEVLDQIFDPFFTTKERGKGTGLGLATVFGIVKQSGGHVTAESDGEGSRFCVYLRAASADQIAAAEPGDGAASLRTVPGRTVLVAEDEESVRMLAVRVLEREGYEVLQAGDGAEALRVADAFPDRIDLLVSDLVMPEMGGRELARRLRVLRPETAILLMSGYDEEMVMGRMDGDDFLPKPFSPNVFAQRVAALLTYRPS
jgi:two-component system, cell cycle sensor histidine kinase and response regulator CckA